jgi:hypothetical protein
MKDVSNADESLDYGESACLSDEVLTEMAVRIASGSPESDSIASESKRHLDSCVSCRLRLEKEILFAKFVRGGLADGGAAPVGKCLSEEELAVYLGGGGEGESRLAFETHLATCSKCVSTLSFLYDEVRSVLRGDETENAPSVSLLTAARERMEEDKRLSLDSAKNGENTPAMESKEGASGGPSAPDEKRKQRYSSQSS